PAARHHKTAARSSSRACPTHPHSTRELTTRVRKGTYNTGSLIGFLTALHEHFDSQPVTLIWDGLP
ncbi:hypothetical protein ACWDKQ_17560, partial [Saccharopolyspora sp. NPDC000995]